MSTKTMTKMIAEYFKTQSVMKGMANVINPERNLPIYQFTIWKIHFYNGQGG